MPLIEDIENSRALISKDESVLKARKYKPLIQMHNQSFTLPRVRKEMAANFKMAIERRRKSYQEQIDHLEQSSIMPLSSNFLLPPDLQLLQASKNNRHFVNQTQQPLNTHFP